MRRGGDDLDEGASRQLTLVIGTTESFDTTIPFRATMALVNNFTNQYVYFPSEGEWVAPFTQGYRLIINGSARAQAEMNTGASTPPGITAAATSAGQVCNITYLEKPVQTSSISQQLSIVASTAVDGTGINVASSITPVSSSTANVAALAALAGRRLLGWTVKENAVATAEIILHHGTGTGDPEIGDRTFTASESATDWFGDTGIGVPNGVFVERVSGTTKLSLYWKTVA